MRFCCAILALVGIGSAMAEEVKKDVPAVREVTLKGLKRNNPRNKVTEPLVITDAETLAKEIPEEESLNAIKKEVNFQKEKVIFFAWSGSGQDKLVFDKLEKGDKGSEAVFKYTAGFTRDLRSHFHLFIVPKDATHKVANAR